MTIAISLKINDGLVLATDSATTVLQATSPTQLSVVNVYSNANKLFNLRKGLPIGAITWGAGSIGSASISTLMKDLRRRFTSKKHDWFLKKNEYTVEAVANRVKEFFFDELYTPTFKDFPQKPLLGFVVGGYSATGSFAEEYQIDIAAGQCTGPRRLRNPEESGLNWSGEPEAINRLLLGCSPQLWSLLQSSGRIDPNVLSELMVPISKALQTPLVFPAMPLQDAIDLADFLVDLSIRFARFKPGANTVGGPIELATISKHEGFRWIKRKYYFDRKLNPDELFTRVYEPKKPDCASDLDDDEED